MTPKPEAQKKTYLTGGIFKETKKTEEKQNIKVKIEGDNANVNNNVLVDLITGTVVPFFKRMRTNSVSKSDNIGLTEIAKDYR